MKGCISTLFNIVTVGQVTQGSVSAIVDKDLRTMIGWFQFQHGEGTTDSWTIDSVNITLSLDRDTSGGSGSGSGSSGAPARIFGVIAGIVAVAIIILIIGVMVLLKKKSKEKKYILENDPTNPVVDNVFQNPLYSAMDYSTQEASLKEQYDKHTQAL